MSLFEVLYPTGRGVTAWETAHAEGLVPDRWPYGLHLVQSSNSTAAFAEAAPLRIPSALRSLIAGLSSSASSTNHRDVAMSWDEDTAIRLFAQRPHAKKYAGVIWTTDRIVRGERDIKDLILRRILPKFSGLWVLSRAQMGVLEEWLGDDAPPITFVRFGIDEKFFSAWPYPQKPLVLSVGRDRDRDSKTLLESLEEVKRVRPDVEVAVQSMSSAPVPPGVRALPMMPHTELRKYYRAASVVAVATRPNVHVSGMTVALESMATARPVVVTGTEGMSDYVEDGVTGVLVRPGDSKSMATGILDLLSDPEASADMGRKGRIRVERQHRTDLMAANLSAILSDS